MSGSDVKRILNVGSYFGITAHRVKVFEALGYQVDFVSETPAGSSPWLAHQPNLYDKLMHKIDFPNDRQGINAAIKKHVKEHLYSFVWVDKSLVLKPSTLAFIRLHQPQLPLIWYSADDMFASHNQSYYFRKGLPLYDLVFTTKSYNCGSSELPKMGAKRVHLVKQGYNHEEHRPIQLSESDRQNFSSDISFIGTFEQDRAEKMLMLAEAGHRVRIWGNGWGDWAHKHSNLLVQKRPLYGDDYAKAICAAKINLCFLRKMNRDLCTTRSIEIPACAAFMLAERTKEHLDLFSEGREAAYFNIEDRQELLDKVNYYIDSQFERERIARHGRERCLKSGYSHLELTKEMLSTIDKLQDSK